MATKILSMKNEDNNKFRNKYRIPSARLASWDYASAGMYFITICTKNREHFFGEIQNDEMILNVNGQTADFCWSNISKHFDFVELGEHTVMPNHTHGIIIINKPVQINSGAIQSKESDARHPRFRNPGKNTISSMIGSFKSSVTKQIHIINPEFGWQSRFHDHIIRSHREFLHISNYIVNNARNWKDDKFYSNPGSNI